MSSTTVLESFLKFSQDLTKSLAGMDEVIGLVFLGSAADTSRVDQWSDHDFFVITKNGLAENFRKNLSWLPNTQEIVMAPRETDHGLKVVYSSGHVLEFAVFNDSELELASANAFAVALDRSNIEERMRAIASRSGKKDYLFDTEFELFLSQLLISVGRARRGETLTARESFSNACLNYVLGFVRHCLAAEPGTEEKTDNLNRFRRFEFQYPTLAKRLDETLMHDAEMAAKGLLEIALEVSERHLSQSNLDQVNLVKTSLNWN